MRFKELTFVDANKILDICEMLKIDFDVWNVDKLVMGTADKVEVGLTPEHWTVVEKLL